MQIGRVWLAALMLGAALFVGGCSVTRGPPELQGDPTMIDDGGSPRLWLLTKQEEGKQVRVRASSRASGTRFDTLFHFDLKVMDPVTARPLWRKRLLTLGDPEAQGYGPSRVIGSAAGARLIGQEGERVWLFVDEYLLAVRASDGEVLATFETIEQNNPELKGLLPGETRYFSFDQGLVLMSTDARTFVLRGPDFRAQPYAPPPPVQVVELKPEDIMRIVPLRPLGEVPARLVETPAGWLGLYTEKEMADATVDWRGDYLRYPYAILDEGQFARRSFWRMAVSEVKNPDDEPFLHLSGATPVPDAPILLRGRFLKVAGTDEPRLLKNPSGLAVWHVTGIDAAGRLALTRIQEDLSTVWTAELPLSDSTTFEPVMVWPMDGRLAIFGDKASTVDGVSRREPRLVSLSLADGQWQGWDLASEAPLAK